jgi:hypothetical protein
MAYYYFDFKDVASQAKPSTACLLPLFSNSVPNPIIEILSGLRSENDTGLQ